MTMTMKNNVFHKTYKCNRIEHGMYTYLQTYKLCEETILEANSSLEDV